MVVRDGIYTTGKELSPQQLALYRSSLEQKLEHRFLTRKVKISLVGTALAYRLAKLWAQRDRTRGRLRCDAPARVRGLEGMTT